MGSPRHSQEQIVELLREAQRRLRQGETLASICKSLGISQPTYRRWQSKYGEQERDNAVSGEGGTGDTNNSRMPAHRWHRIFWPTFCIVFFITLSYPIGMLLTTTDRGYSFTVMRYDLAWSFFAVFLIPILFGLLATSFRLDLFRRLDFLTKTVLILIFLLPLVPIYFAVEDDTQDIPSPDRISQGQQKDAIDIDECIRDQRCAPRHLELVSNCLNNYSSNKYSQKFRVLEDKNNDYEKVHAYICALLEKSGGKIAMGPMTTIIFVLKIVLALFVWSYVYYTFFLAYNYFSNVNPILLYTSIGSFTLFLMWLPLQLYAEWYHWYGNTSHVTQYNSSFVGFVALAISLILLFVTWVLIVMHSANAITTIGSINAIVFAIVGVLAFFKPGSIDGFFNIMDALPSSVFVLLLFMILFYIFIYIRLITMFSTGEARRQQG